MTNLPIQHANLPQETGYSQGINDNFSALQEEYDKAVKKLQKSDFANSPVAYENELTMLKKLITAAKEQGLTEKVKDLEAREQEIYTKIANNAVSANSMPFYKPITAGTIAQTPDVGDFAVKGHKEINFNGDPFASFLLHKFEDTEAVKKGIEEIYKAGVDKNVTVKILNSLRIKDPDTKINKIDAKAMHFVAEMKNTFVQSRNNEKVEYENPIKHLDEIILESKSFDGRPIKFIFKDDILIYSTPLSGEPSKFEMMKKYKESILEEEDKFLYDFVNKYKTEDGKIDNKYVRVFMALRQYGVTRSHMLELIEACLKDDGSFDRNMLSSIAELKKANVLSADLIPIINSAKNPDTGEVDKNYIEKAKSLTKAIMTGKQVITLLNKAEGNEESYNFMLKFADIFKDPEKQTGCFKTVNQLSNIVKNVDGHMDENAMDIVNALIGNRSILNEKNEIKSDDFIKTAFKMVNFAKKTSEPKGTIAEETTAAIFEMCKKSIPVETQLEILGNCMDEKNNVNPTLAKIAWNMAWDDEDKETIIDMLQSCHNGKHVDSEKAKETLALFDVYIPDNYDAM